MKVLSDPLAMDGLLPEGTFGWFGFYGTLLFIDPEDALVAVMLVQTFMPSMSDEFETAVMQAVIDCTSLRPATTISSWSGPLKSVCP